MSKDELSLKIIEAYNDIQKYPSIGHVLAAVGISETSLNRKIRDLRLKGEKLIDRKAPPAKAYEISKEDMPEVHKSVRENQQLKGQIKALKEQLDHAHHESVSNEKIMELIRGTKNYDLVTEQPEWLYLNEKNTTRGTPVLFLSDIHFDEVVESSQIGGVNSYNHEICEARLKHTFNKALDTFCNTMGDTEYNGSVVILGGDIVSGNIHEELAETNDATILQTVMSAVQILGDGIEKFADEFGKVYVPCVVGNHGRLHKKPRFKYKVQQNYEWIIYNLIAQRFAKDKRITVHIPDSPDCLFKVHKVTFLLTHGDQFKGGNGISGIYTPLMLGRSKKLSRYAALGTPFDVMMCGHFHTYIHDNRIIINGSVKGFDEFSANLNFSYEPPQQAAFIVDPKEGISIRFPIKCNGYEEKEGKSKAKK